MKKLLFMGLMLMSAGAFASNGEKTISKNYSLILADVCCTKTGSATVTVDGESMTRTATAKACVSSSGNPQNDSNAACSLAQAAASLAARGKVASFLENLGS